MQGTFSIPTADGSLFPGSGTLFSQGAISGPSFRYTVFEHLIGGAMNRHFGREALLRLLSGLGDEEERVEAIRHVARCRRCLGSAAGYLLEGGRTRARNTLALFVEAEVRESVDTLKARGWWAEMRDLSPAEQVRKIRSTAALQSLPVFEVILEDARTTGRSDPYVGESLIQAAWTIVDLLPEARYPKTRKNDLRGQALTVVANCRRIAAEFTASAQAIEAARRYLAQGTGDPGLEAGLLSIHCSLSTDTGDFELALTYVRRAVDPPARGSDRKGQTRP